MSTAQIDEMTNFEKSRWFAMIEAIDLIARTCDDRDINFDELKISPLDIEKYIEKTCDIFARKLDEDDEKEAISKTQRQTTCNTLLLEHDYKSPQESSPLVEV